MAKDFDGDPDIFLILSLHLCEIKPITTFLLVIPQILTTYVLFHLDPSNISNLVIHNGHKIQALCKFNK